ncbi:MAG: VWA-like domain-containing protein [Pseudomonadota bacterium]
MAMAIVARERMGRVLERWFLTEPVLFSLWSDHRLAIEPIATIRVGGGVIGYNPSFIEALTPTELEATLRAEAVRILLKHPYSRRLLPPHIAYLASNITLQEHLRLPLPLPTATEVFGHHDHDRQFYEFYHHQLLLQAPPAPEPQPGAASHQKGDVDTEGTDAAAGRPSPLQDYAVSPVVGLENTREWGEDELISERIDERVADAELTQRWGTLPGTIRQRVLANGQPRLDYRAVLRRFRASVLSSRRRLTRMKPSRRYGFLYMGSRYDFTTRLLVAVDVSGSMSDRDLALGFSIVNRFFKYGVEQVDVIAFDTEIHGEPLSLKRARREIVIEGRGGTDFNAPIAYLDQHVGYDGLILFTDGIAPPPRPPKARGTQLLWIFNNEKTYQVSGASLRHLGAAVFLRDSP